MPDHVCERCGVSFTQKIHLAKHLQRKRPCNPLDRSKSLGQYFTIAEELQQFVFDKTQNKGSCVLEPSFGAGHLLQMFIQSNPDYPICGFELDSTIKPIITFNENQHIVYADFTHQKLTQKFKTIIGNPPYVKQSGKNLYIQFVEICYELLDSEGELIFIVPSDFMKTTHAAHIIEKMTQNGSFTDFLFPHNEKLFANASVDVVVFRYQKGVQTNTTTMNGETVFVNVKNGILTLSKHLQYGTSINDLFDVYVGLVSGKDGVFKTPIGNMFIRTDFNKLERFIFEETFPTSSGQINDHLMKHKDELMARRIKSFDETNWFQWGAPRNIKHIKEKMARPCIYIKTITRDSIVAKEDEVQYFGGSLLCLVPKSSTIHLQPITEYLNSIAFREEYTYAGRFKIGHKQVSNAIIPFS